MVALHKQVEIAVGQLLWRDSAQQHLHWQKPTAPSSSQAESPGPPW